MEPEAVMLLLALVTLFTILATLFAASWVFSRFWRDSNMKLAMGAQVSEEFFVTARNAGSTWLLTCSWYSSLSGAWIVPTCAFYGNYYGLLGMLYYNLTVCLEPVTTALVSRAAYTILPKGASLPASIRSRYGRALELYTLAFMGLSEAICLTGEYTAIASLLTEVLGIPAYATLLVYGSFSVLYTLIGGALVGLFTAQFHCLLALLCLPPLAYYYSTIAPAFPPSLPATLLAYGPAGRPATLATLYQSIYANQLFALFFNSFWQKTICSRSTASTIRSSIYGGSLLLVATTFFSLTGAAASWKDAARPPVPRTSPPPPHTPYAGTAYLLHLDPLLPDTTAIASVLLPTQYWFGVTFLAFSCVSSKAAIDSWSDGLLCGVYGSLRLRRRRLPAARAIVLVLNAVCLLAASQGLSLLGLYTIANMACASLAFPLFLSICVPRLSVIATAPIVIASSLSGLLACCAYGVAVTAAGPPIPHTPLRTVLVQGLKLAFYTNNYAWQFILLSLGAPLVVYTMLMLLQDWQRRRLQVWRRVSSDAGRGRAAGPSIAALQQQRRAARRRTVVGGY